MDTNTQDLAFLQEVTRQAGAIALDYFNKGAKSWAKSDNSPVTEADLAVDAFLKQTLLAERAYGWLSEETVDNPARLKAKRVIIVDPIDGTRSFAAGKTDWVVAVAIVENSRPVVGVVYNAVKDQMFCASLGQGAYMNGAKLETSTTSDLNNMRFSNMSAPVLKAFKNAGLNRPKVTPCHAFAYRVSLVAKGAVDASVTYRPLCDWDAAAADLILHEAGGRMTDRHGQLLRYNQPSTKHSSVIAAGKLYTPLHSLLEKAI